MNFAMPGSRPLHHSLLSKSSELLGVGKPSSRFDSIKLTPSQSETCLPMMTIPRSRTPGFFTDEEERRIKEEKRHQLQMEIAKRKMQIEENTRLQYELKKLAESGELSRQELEEVRGRYQQYIMARNQLPRSSSESVMLPRGIIKPIDYEFYDATSEPALYTRQEYAAYRDMIDKSVPRERYFPQPSYSSTEYMAHRSDRSPVGPIPRAELDALAAGMQAGDYLLDDIYRDSGGHVLSPTAHYGLAAPAHPVHYPTVSAALASYGGYARQPVMSVMEAQYAQYPEYLDPIQLQHHQQQQLQYQLGYGYPEFASLPTEAEMQTPPSDVTPAMPILDDVTKRSRSLLRDIGSRPLSDDMEKYFLAEGRFA